MNPKYLILRSWIDKNKLNWEYLSINPNAIHLLEANQDNIYWYSLSVNPSIFTYDYEKIKSDHSVLKQDLMKYLFQPKFIEKYFNKF